eukprot:2077701-Rhodomonas_salina.1
MLSGHGGAPESVLCCQQLMANELPNVWGNSQGRLNQFAREVWPSACVTADGPNPTGTAKGSESGRAAGTEMDFPSYMHFLYVCLNEQPGNRIPGDLDPPPAIEDGNCNSNRLLEHDVRGD